MNIPVLKGLIKRRILVNFHADPAVVQAILPQPFRPKLHQGEAIVGICLIRLEQIRPAVSPLAVGISSENAAHRIAVEWEEEGQTKQGVYIPRRDTGSQLNHLAGGRLFPGEHHLAHFEVHSTDTEIDFHMQSEDGLVKVDVTGKIDSRLPDTSNFASLEEASAFFEAGSLGYSVRHDSPGLDGMLLKTKSWHVDTLDVSHVYSSYYADETLFSSGSVTFDHALIMRDIEHEWHGQKEMIEE